MFNLRKVLVSTGVLVLLLAAITVVAYADSGTITGSVVNVRQSPSTGAKVLTQVEKGTSVSVLEKSDGWYKIEYDGVKGWVYGEYISVKKAVAVSAKITLDDVNFREGPSTSDDVMRSFSEGEKVTVLGRSGEWYKVEDSDDVVGWVHSKYVSIDKSSSRGSEAIVPEVAAEKSSSNNSVAKQIIKYAKQYLGVKYVYGGSSPKGFDCSGFVQYVFGKFGIDLDRVACDQARQGTKVSKSGLKLGDLVFFGTDGDGYIDHVGIYIGDGQFIHAASGRKRVMITSLSESYYVKYYVTSRRILS